MLLSTGSALTLRSTSRHRAHQMLTSNHSNQKQSREGCPNICYGSQRLTCTNRACVGDSSADKNRAVLIQPSLVCSLHWPTYVRSSVGFLRAGSSHAVAMGRDNHWSFPSIRPLLPSLPCKKPSEVPTASGSTAGMEEKGPPRLASRAPMTIWNNKRAWLLSEMLLEPRGGVPGSHCGSTTALTVGVREGGNH